MSGTPVALDCWVPIWDRFYLVHPLVIIGTVESDGTIDLAPKHIAGPVSWENHFGFIGDGAHAPSECIDIRNLVPRTALLAELLIEPIDGGGP